MDKGRFSLKVRLSLINVRFSDKRSAVVNKRSVSLTKVWLSVSKAQLHCQRFIFCCETLGFTDKGAAFFFNSQLLLNFANELYYVTFLTLNHCGIQS